MRGARRSPTRGGLIFLCSIQQSRPTRGRPGHIESYPNPSVASGKPSRRPAVTAHMPHVPPEHPNSHSRSATASERLGFPLVRNGFRMLHVPLTGHRYYRGYPPGQKKISQFPEGYRASDHQHTSPFYGQPYLFCPGDVAAPHSISFSKHHIVPGLASF
jgi:hypothetical protein